MCRSLPCGRRLALNKGPGPFDYIETHHGNFNGKEGKLMSDFEMLSIMLMILAIIVPLMVALITKK